MDNSKSDDLSGLKFQALHLAYTSLLQALHERGVLPISDVVTAMGNALDYQRQSAPNKSVNPLSEHLYRDLLDMEAQFAASQNRQAGGSDSQSKP